MSEQPKLLDAGRVDAYLADVANRYRQRVSLGMTPREGSEMLRWANDLEAIRRHVAQMTLEALLTTSGSVAEVGYGIETVSGGSVYVAMAEDRSVQVAARGADGKYVARLTSEEVRRLANGLLKIVVVAESSAGATS